MRRYEAERRRADELESVQEVARAALCDPRPRRAAAPRRPASPAPGGGRHDRRRRGRRRRVRLPLRARHRRPGPGGQPRARRTGGARPELLRESLGAPGVEVCALEVARPAPPAPSSRLAGRRSTRPLAACSRPSRARSPSRSSTPGAVPAEREQPARPPPGGPPPPTRPRGRGRAAGHRGPGGRADEDRARTPRRGRAGPDRPRRFTCVRWRTTWSPRDPRSDRGAPAVGRRGLGRHPRARGTPASRPRSSEHGLVDAIDEQAAQLRAAGLAVDVDLRGIDPALGRRDETVLFRVVQEALTNVARHSGASARSVVVERPRRPGAPGRGGRRHGFDPSAPTARLGLAGIRERVEMIGGRLRIESTPRCRDRRRGRRGDASEPDRTVRILLVDDHAVLRAGAASAPGARGRPRAGGRGGDARRRRSARCRGCAPDVVVIDIEMPGIGGLEGAARIRERAPDARVLVLSMHDQARDVRQAFEAGADGYLRRPRPTRIWSGRSARSRRVSGTSTRRWARPSRRRRPPARSTS